MWRKLRQNWAWYIKFCALSRAQCSLKYRKQPPNVNPGSAPDTCHILATTGSFGCASSVTVSEVLQGQQQVLKEKQITTVTARSEMSFATDGF